MAQFPLLCLLLAAPPDGERLLQLSGDEVSPKGIVYDKIYSPIVVPHPGVEDLALPPLFDPGKKSFPYLIEDFEISTVESAELLSSADLPTRANASAIVQQRAALVEREVVRQLRAAAKDPDPAATSQYHTLVAVARNLRIPGAASILVERVAFTVDAGTLPVGGGTGLDTYIYSTAEALLAIGGRPVVDAVLDRLAGRYVGVREDRRIERIPPADVYVLTWILQESLGRSLAKAAVAARLAQSRRPDMILAAQLLEQEDGLDVDSRLPEHLAAEIERLPPPDGPAEDNDE